MSAADPSDLVRYLRTGGYVQHARRLREYLAEYGAPCTRRVGGIELVFHLGPDGWSATCEQRLIATSYRCHIPLPELRALRALERPVDEGLVSVRLGAAKARLDRVARDRGVSSGALARAAILAYLDARGAP